MMMQPAKKLARMENINPLLKLRMDAMSIKDMPTLSKVASVPTSTLYATLCGRNEMGLPISRKVAQALAFPYELFVKVYLRESLTDTELQAVAGLCNLSFADVLNLQRTLTLVKEQKSERTFTEESS